MQILRQRNAKQFALLQPFFKTKNRRLAVSTYFPLGSVREPKGPIFTIGLKALVQGSSFCCNIGMNRIVIVTVCLLFNAWSAYAASPLTKGIGSVLTAQKRISMPLKMQRTLALEMRNYPLNTRRLALDDDRIEELYWNCSVKYPRAMRADISKQYYKALSATKRLAKTLDTEIFYQGTFENRQLDPIEIYDRLRAINSTLAQVEAAKVYFDARGDIPLREAETYLLRRNRFYQMLSSGEFGPLDEIPPSALEKAKKTYKSEDFFLEDPITESADALQLPDKVRVAVIREEEEETETIVSAFEHLREKEEFSQWQFDIYNSSEQFLRTSGCLTYDLVITDIMMGYGGGLYLARKLRFHKFDGGILALTGFYQKEQWGIAMKAEGIDGSIYTGSFKYEPNVSDFLAQKLRNYFYYRQLPKEDVSDGIE